MNIAYVLLNNLNEIDKSKWTKLEQESNFKNLFQTHDYFCFLQKTDGLNPFVYGIMLNDELLGVIVGYTVSKKNSLWNYFFKRAVIQGAPLFSRNIPKEAIDSLLQHINRRLRNSIYIEFRNYYDLKSIHESFIDCDYIYKEHLNFKINCTNQQTIYDQLDVNRKREIRNITKQAYVCSEAKTKEEVIELYTILRKLYIEKLQLPLFDKNFFLTIFEQNFSKIFVVKKNEVIFGGIVCVNDEDTLYEWFVCGEVVNKISPQVLATWHAINFAYKNNIKTFDFMGAGKPNEYYGVREFKSRFGGELVQYGRYVKVQKKYFYIFFSILLKIFRKKSI